MWIIEIDYLLLVLVIISMITRTIVGSTHYMNEYKIWRKVNNFLLFCILLDLFLNFVHS
jgi:uncharacterized membrane protein (DUF373 family)